MIFVPLRVLPRTTTEDLQSCQALLVIYDGEDRLISLGSQLTAPDPVARHISLIACDGQLLIFHIGPMRTEGFIATLGICLRALLQLQGLYGVMLVILCAVREPNLVVHIFSSLLHGAIKGPRAVSLVFQIVSDFQYPSTDFP